MKDSLLAIGVGLAVVTIACGGSSSTQTESFSGGQSPICEADVARQLNRSFQEALVEFLDTTTLAIQQPRLLLSNSISDMQDMRRTLDFRDTPPCGIALKDAVVEAMNAEISRFSRYLRGTPAPNFVADTALAAVELLEPFLEWDRQNNCPNLASGCPSGVSD